MPPPRIRRSVYSLADEGPELTWYRRAVGRLKSMPLTTFGSWEFIGACHGIDKSVAAPPAGRHLWRECQHQTWFFLPWHRAYIAGFEAVIASIIEDLGGPSEWALPYWNYTDQRDPRARELPPAFRSSTSAEWFDERSLVAPAKTHATPESSHTVGRGREPIGHERCPFHQPARQRHDWVRGPEHRLEPWRRRQW